MRYCIFGYDKKCTDFSMNLMERKIKAISNITINELDIGSRNGSTPTRVKIGKGSIKLVFECFANPTEIYDNIRNFINYLNPMNGQKKISFSDELDKYRWGMLSNGDDIEYFYSQVLTFGKFTLEFTMFDPYTYRKDVCKYYYNGKAGATAILTNNGGDECPVKMKVYAPKGLITTKYEEDNASVVYTGTWAVYATSHFSGGNSKYATATGASASLQFSGTGIKVYGLKSAGKGKANIYIDGVLNSTVDCYAAVEDWNATLFSKTDLTPGTHTIKVEVSGQKNASATGYQINIDYFQSQVSSIPTDVLPLTVTGQTFNYETVPTVSNVKVYIGSVYVGYDTSIIPTDELIIDTKEYAMTLNAMNSLDHWTGDMPQLKAGANTVTVSDTDSSGALVIFEFNERWL